MGREDTEVELVSDRTMLLKLATAGVVAKSHCQVIVNWIQIIQKTQPWLCLWGGFQRDERKKAHSEHRRYHPMGYGPTRNTKEQGKANWDRHSSLLLYRRSKVTCFLRSCHQRKSMLSTMVDCGLVLWAKASPSCLGLLLTVCLRQVSCCQRRELNMVLKGQDDAGMVGGDKELDLCHTLPGGAGRQKSLRYLWLASENLDKKARTWLLWPNTKLIPESSKKARA